MRLADPKPHACAVCLQPPNVRTPQPEFVDFEVAYEGPVLTRHGETVSPEQTVPIPVDDLVICEDCLRRAAELVGMEHGEEARARIAALEEDNAAKDEEIADKDKWISNLEKSVGFAIDHPVKRPHGKPRIDGPEDKQDEITELRKRKAQMEKAAKTRRLNKEKVKV